MMTEVKKDVKNLRMPKVFWGIGKLMLKLASSAFNELRVAHSYKIKIANLEKERDEKLTEIQSRRTHLIDQIYSLAREIRGNLVETESITLATGQVGWRAKAAAVKIADGFTEEGIVAKLLRRSKFLRIRRDLNREALLEAHHRGERLPKGVTIQDGDEFFISLAPRGKQKPKVITRNTQIASK